MVRFRVPVRTDQGTKYQQPMVCSRVRRLGWDCQEAKVLQEPVASIRVMTQNGTR